MVETNIGSFLYSNGNYTNLLSSDFESFDLNDAGQIVGRTSAVPEPSTWAMLLIGFAAITIVSALRRPRSQLFG